ncbi:MAG: hypothetical protein LBI15_02395 [Dysgonamonadaceae bacterium]|jgi:hypothetical protein|nr:hypothetical protein [Dysgonamonadaceae bacterium]
MGPPIYENKHLALPNSTTMVVIPPSRESLQMERREASMNQPVDRYLYPYSNETIRARQKTAAPLNFSAHGEFWYNTAMDELPNAPRALRHLGTNWSRFNFVVDGVNLHRQYKTNKRVNFSDTIGFVGGGAGFTAQFLSRIGIGGSAVPFLRRASSYVAVGLIAFDLYALPYMFMQEWARETDWMWGKPIWTDPDTGEIMRGLPEEFNWDFYDPNCWSYMGNPD